MNDNKPTINADKIKFLELHKDLSKSEILNEILYNQNVILNKLERTRKNTFIIIFILIFPILIYLVMVLFGLIFLN